MVANKLYHSIRVLKFLIVMLSVSLLPDLVFSQSTRGLKIVSPPRDSSTLQSTKTFFSGVTRPDSKLWLNNVEVKVYSTGSFALPVNLQSGRNEFQVLNIFEKDTLQKKLVINSVAPTLPKDTKGFAIEFVKFITAQDLWLMPGEKLQVEMKATPGKTASFYNGIPMFEADSLLEGVRGIYRGEYLIQASDTLKQQYLSIRLYDPITKKSIKATTKQAVTVIDPKRTIVGVTTGDRPYLDFSIGEDRLGGAKLGYLDSLVSLEVTGKIGNSYRVRLTDNMQAYIPEKNLHLLKGVHFRPASITGSWSVNSDGKADYVTIGLAERLPYSSIQEINPSQIVIDIYGAVSNTNWITQKQGLKAIKNVWYKQISKDVFRVFIELQKPQLWGYDVYYRGRALTIKVKAQPEKLSLADLTIGVDAGHGGSNIGAAGLSGVLEKNITLAIALKLRTELEKNGAKVIMTRERDTSFSNPERVKWMKLQQPDLLVSIHCNSSNPMAQGTSTYYKYIAYRPLSQYIYNELLQLGLKDFGNVGSFNFFFNTPTEYPTVLVETDFISNPEMEEKLINDSFQQQMAEGIVRGIKQFLVAQLPAEANANPAVEPIKKRRSKRR